MELVAALLLGPAVSSFLRKPLHGWLVLTVPALLALYCLIRFTTAPPGSSYLFWSGLALLASLSVGVTTWLRFRPRSELPKPVPAPTPVPIDETKLNRRQRRQNRKR